MPLAVASVNTGGTPIAFCRILVIVAATWYVWALMTPVVARLAEHHRIERPFSAGALGIHVVAALSACAIQALVAAITTSEVGQSPAPFTGIFAY
jgi:hypothetical protein